MEVSKSENEILSPRCAANAGGGSGDENLIRVVTFAKVMASEEG